MKRLLVFIWAFAPLLAFATDETCPAGYYPAEYAELEYIESTGTQYIDTGIKLEDKSFRFEVEFEPTTNVGAIIGNQLDGDMLYRNGPLLGGYFGVSGSIAWLANNRKVVIAAYDKSTYNRSILIDSQIITGNKKYSPSNRTIKLFANTGYIPGDNARGKLYSAKIYVDNNVIINLIPTKRLSDNVIGMLDIVGGKFYGNDGTGEFIAGPEVGDSIAIQHHICVSCPANTYKPNAGNVACTKCPTGTFSPIGSTSRSDCAKILRINDYVVYMPLGKRTEHGLCVMWNDEKYCADVYKKQ